VNRLLLLPSDLNMFPSTRYYSAGSQLTMANPETALDQLRAYFPADRGAFWFAAGISFNSFSLVDSIAGIGVAIRMGSTVNLIGLARAGLPNPSFPLVQIELRWWLALHQGWAANGGRPADRQLFSAHPGLPSYRGLRSSCGSRRQGGRIRAYAGGLPPFIPRRGYR